MATAKQSAQKLLDRLPDDAGWDDIMYELYVRQKIELGQQAVAEAVRSRIARRGAGF